MSIPGPRTVVFVGQRSRAFSAAAALGLRVVCVDGRSAKARDARPVRHLEQSLTDPLTDWSAVARKAAKGARPQAVFALTEKAVVPAALLRAELGLAGDSPAAARRTTDKLTMKRAITAAGLPCARFVDAAEGLGARELADRLGLPLVVKARVGSGSRQTRVCRRRIDLTALEDGWMAESFVEGVEMSFESLVAGGRTVFTNPTEYFRVRWANIAPAAIEPEILRSIERLNARVIAALGVETAFCHLELFLTPDGPVFGEIAARPPGGHITDLIELAYGFDPWQAWLRLGLGERVTLPTTARRSAGVWMLHPGESVIRRIAGLEKARSLPGVERVIVRARPGTLVASRVGTGQEIGHLVVTGDDREQVADRLRAAHRAVRVSLERIPPDYRSRDPAAADRHRLRHRRLD